MKTAGIILTIFGLVGTVLFGIKALNNSESFSAFGVNVAVSDANWTPVIVSLVVLVFGVILLLVKRK